MRSFYLLDKEHHQVTVDFTTWARLRCDFENHVGYTIIDDCHVSTVFLGLDVRLSSSKGPPLTFETLVQGGPLDQCQKRYSSWEDAEIGHWAMVRRVCVAMRRLVLKKVEVK